MTYPIIMCGFSIGATPKSVPACLHLPAGRCRQAGRLGQRGAKDRVYVAGDDEWNELQMRLFAVADTAAMPTGPDAAKQEPVREEKQEKGKREKHKKQKKHKHTHKHTSLSTVRPWHTVSPGSSYIKGPDCKIGWSKFWVSFPTHQILFENLLSYRTGPLQKIHSLRTHFEVLFLSH